MSITTLLLYIHLSALTAAGIGVLYADHLGFAWLRGHKDTLLKTHLLAAHHLVSIALAVLIGTGVWMFWPMHTYLLHQPLFLLKMAFVAALVINSFVIGRIMHITTAQSFASLSPREKLPFLVSGAVSSAAWVGAVAMALFQFYF